jgi:hypothetical protein
MRINLISQKEYLKIQDIYKMFPNLTLQNVGYEKINKEVLSPTTKLVLQEVETILSKSIVGFINFSNFKITSEGFLLLRFKYNYNYDGRGIPFTGVGYILLEELLKGFKE